VLNAGEPKIGGAFHFGFRVAAAAHVADPDGYEIEIYADL